MCQSGKWKTCIHRHKARRLAEKNKCFEVSDISLLHFYCSAIIHCGYWSESTSESTLAPSHYLKQRWLIITDVLLHFLEINFRNDHKLNLSWKITFFKLLPHIPGPDELTYWGRVTHICIGNLTTIDWDIVNWTLGKKHFIEIHIFSFNKMHLKMSSAQWR